MRKISKQTLDGNVETLLLAILQDGPSYGYAITKDLHTRADGILKLGEGTIYPVLHRLEEKKLISARWIDADNKRPRKYYRITPKGRKTLAENCQQWQLLSQVMEKILNVDPAVSDIAKGAFL